MPLYDTTHAEMSPEQLEAAGIYQNTIRLSIGTEHIDDIIWDLEQGFKAAAKDAIASAGTDDL